jgi:hypothetical protein
MKRIPPQWLWSAAAVAALVLAFVLGRHTAPARTAVVSMPSEAGTKPAAGAAQDATMLYAHNLLLRKGPHFRVYVRWIRGQMLRTKAAGEVSLDAPESFLLEIQKGVVDARYADIADFLNSGQTAKPPLSNIKLENHEGQLQISGTAHKVISVPVRLDGTLTPTPDGRLRYHLVKLNVLKIPMKGLFGLFHLDLQDLMPKTPTPGMQASGNDIYFDTQRLLPPPHIHGNITSVIPTETGLRVIYGNAPNDDDQLAQWHNFLRLVGGTVSFGKLTMQRADLTMIDATDDPWFDLDLANYQAQLVYGTTHMTQRAGVEVYMPDLDHLTPAALKAAQGVSLAWLRNRKTVLPVEPAK